MIRIKHRFNIEHKPRGPRSIVSVTEPNQAPDLRYIIQQVSQGKPVSVLEMRADNDATLDDPDLRYTSMKHLTSESIDHMLNHLESQQQEIAGDSGLFSHGENKVISSKQETQEEG